MTMIQSAEELDRVLLDAHAREDTAALVDLYERAADMREGEGDVDAACFYLTHAFVFALSTGAQKQHSLHRRLYRYGREA